MKFFLSLGTFFMASLVIVSSENYIGGPNAIAFLTKLLGKLTLPKYFSASDKIVQDIANDASFCAANGSTLNQTTTVLGNNANNYKATLCTTKASMGNILLTFMNCVANTCKDGAWDTWLAGTLGVALKNVVTDPYKKCTANVANMTKAGKTIPQRVETISSCGTACVTNDIIERVINQTMKRSCSCTWISCVRPIITQQVLNISQYIKTTNILMANCPSKLANQV